MSLELKKRGDTWTYVVDVGRDPLTGKRKRKSKSGFKTKGECRTAASLILAELEKGTYFEIIDITFEDYMKRYFKSIEKQVKPKTYGLYEYINRVHLIPNFGKMKLSKIKPLHIQEFYNKSLEKLSNITVRHFHNVLNMAFNQAIRWQIINFNPCNSVDRPKIKKKQLNIWTTEQVQLCLNRIKQLSIYLPTLLAVSTGMREAEICGLTWNDIDMDNKIIYVKNQLQKENKKLVLTELKTYSSKRNISISDSIISILNSINDKQEENRTYFGDNYNENNYVVCKNNGDPYAPDYISRNFARTLRDYKIAEQLNIPIIRFHDLRHTHATILLRLGTNPKIVAERLGHSTISMTLDTYSHVLPSLQKEAATKLNDIFLE